ncbi:vacuolar protein sorting-associated protein 13D-like [Tropilaelaps mercedesae]|uniref:Vacuolar protein sorting-associated protein 13D-like n=1 Tax=Tropilaelaps mercedesae TaxID=418985 RepID=A0A1V9X416_9ACAR|nr:vacuolar protein sorting-associated protein 13D-like [Tropilaelaps mercedesae]
MLEGLVAWVLNNSVGRYVENLNTSQLSVGILQGQVELEDLPLKKEAFRQLLFPLEIKNGYIGKVVLKIPVTRIRTDPWTIIVERLYVVVGPVSLDQYNGELYEELKQINKLSKLNAFEAEWKAARLRRESRNENEYYSHSYSSWLTYGSSLMSSAISNLQLHIQDVHVRYEDVDPVTGNSFAWGLLVKSAQSEHVAGNSSPTSGDLPKNAKSYVSQQLQLRGVSLYWDQDALHVGGLELGRMANRMDNLRNFCVRSNETSCEHHFMLGTPEGAELLLSRNQSERPLRSRSEPRIKCTLQVSMLPISLTDGQYRQMVRCVQNIDTNHKKWKYQKWRPTVPVKGNCKLWWTFAMKAATETLMKRRACATMEYALKKAQEVNRYVKLYRQHLTEDGALGKEQLDDKSTIEKSYDFETLLTLREIIMKQLDDECNSKNVATANGRETQTDGGGILQYFFPGWSGWYGGTHSGTLDADGGRTQPLHGQDIDSETASLSMVTTEGSIPASQFEEELLAALNRLDDEHYLLRDATFAHVTFQLKTCTITLFQQVGGSLISASGAPASAGCRELAVLRVEDVWAQLKSHPRARSYCFHVKVGGLQFTDRTLPNLVYAHLVAPHTAQETQMSLRSGQKISASDLLRPRSAESSSGASPTPPATTPMFFLPPLFEVAYERNPLGSTADHRLVINTQSLDIVYNPSTVRALKGFLRSPGMSALDDSLSDAVQQHLEQLTRETKTSLRSKVDAMLSGRQLIQRWDLCLDICAPRIIVPESFTDRTSVAVMFDLGRLQFRNLASFDKPKIERKRSSYPGLDENDDEDFFQTPCSSPPGENESTILSEPRVTEKDRLPGPPGPITSPGMESCAVSEADFRERMYDRYSLNLQDMQVMVTTCSKESWKFAQLRGSSHLHVIDRFNISIQMERRILYTDDPQFPSVVVRGQLPKLVLHVSEQKVSALASCSRLLGAGADSGLQDDLGHVPLGNRPSMRSPLQRPNDDSVLFVGRFVVEQMSIELQSRGRCLAELQVSGFEVTYTRHPRAQSIQLRVQGLLLVDALQTHGPDFDLLLASHKHITMDSRSGSIRDSEPASPVSPASPKGQHCVTPPLTAATAEAAVIKPNMLTSLLSTLHRSVMPATGPPPSGPSLGHSDQMMFFTGRDHDFAASFPIGNDSDNNNQSDALIVLDLTWSVDTGYEMRSGGETNNLDGLDRDFVLHVAFNNLDVIANQETIVELVTFAQSIHKASHQQGSSSQVQSTREHAPQAFKASSVNMSFDFHRLNILLLRSTADKTCSPSSGTNLKLATATLSGAKIDALLGDILDLRVILGGLQVCNLLSPGRVDHGRRKSTAQSGKSSSATLKEAPSTGSYVLNVGLNPDLASNDTLLLGRQMYNTGPASGASESAAFTLHVIREYPHTAAVHWNSTLKRRQRQQQQQQQQQQQPLDGSAKKRKTGVIGRRSGDNGNMLLLDLHLASVVYTHCPSLLLELTNCAFEFRSYVTKLAASLRDAAAEVAKGIVGSEPQTQNQLNVNVSVILETPVIILPCEVSRPLVLVAHLGRVTVSSANPRPHVYRIRLNNTSLYTLDAERNPDFDCEKYGRAILHNTHVELTLQQGGATVPQRDPTEEEFLAGEMEMDELNSECEESTTWQLDGCLVGPLKVALSKSQFSQLLDTLSEMGTSASDASAEGSTADNDETTMNASATSEGLGSRTPKTGTLEAACVLAHFAIAEFLVEFCEEQGKPFARVAFHEFDFEMIRHTRQNRINMSLHGLAMEDLYEEETSNHRTLISSRFGTETSPEMASGERPMSQANTMATPPAAPLRCDYLSASCPSFGVGPMATGMPAHQLVSRGEDTFAFSALSHSLPDVLCTKNLFKKLEERRPCTSRRSRRRVGGESNQFSRAQERSGRCPQTPPPSPTPSLHLESAELHADASAPEATLVKIEVVTQTRGGACGHNARNVNIDINSLLVCINVRPWVMVVDLLSRPAYGPSKMRMKVDEGLPTQDMNTTLEMSVQNLAVQLNSRTYEICEAQIRQLWFRQELTPRGTTMQGRLGKVLVFDLTPFGGKVYQERFVTPGNEAFQFAYRTTENDADCYTLECNIPGTVRIVHTHLFLCEVINSINEFTLAYEVLTNCVPLYDGSQLTSKADESQATQRSAGRRKARIDLRVTADAPLIVIPRNSHHSDALVVNLGRVDIRTTFVQTRCLNQVMQLSLSEMDMYCGVYSRGSQKETRKPSLEQIPFRVTKKGCSLLDDKFEMNLRVMRNLDSETIHTEPDWTVRGHVSQATISLDKAQYQLVAGILFENLSEGVHLQTSAPAPVVAPAPDDDAWLHLALVLDLHNVTLNLMEERTAAGSAAEVTNELSLARIEFIDSKLAVSLFTNGRKDVDLVSQAIRVYDTRFKNAVRRNNVFTDMLLPNQSGDKGETRTNQARGLQMELHYRTFPNRLTVLLNNMRLMAIFDWFRQTSSFLALPSTTTSSQANGAGNSPPEMAAEPPSLYNAIEHGTDPTGGLMALQLKVSMTDTEVVVVEDASTLDSNAVILKSTAVLTWHGATHRERPLICALQNLEVFSCVLGAEHETALSIIDPASISFELNLRSGQPSASTLATQTYELEACSQLLCIRLSYNDIKMFHKILECLRGQAAGKAASQAEVKVTKLRELGFSHGDCATALHRCNGQIDDAALWLVQNAQPLPEKAQTGGGGGATRIALLGLSVSTATVRLADFRVCFIDDCGNADVPLLELRLRDTDASLALEQRNWQLRSSLHMDYYNRILSGWEPLLEPITVNLHWRRSSSSMHIIELEVDGLLNVNITSALIDIVQRVRESWRDDNNEATGGVVMAAAAANKRTPFVPFALKNSLGCALEFATTTTVLGHSTQNLQPQTFFKVPPGASVPFSFATGRGSAATRLRHQESHVLQARQIIVRVEGCEQMAPLAVDRVGTYFRLVKPANSSIEGSVARVVFHIELEGPALKVIHVRSALMLKNFTTEGIAVNITTSSPVGSLLAVNNKNLSLGANSSHSLPFAFNYASLKVRPLREERLLPTELGWRCVTFDLPEVGVQRECVPLHAGICPCYFAVTVRRDPYPSVMFTQAEKEATGHTLLVRAPVKLFNLLPLELHYTIDQAMPSCGKLSGVLKSRCSVAFHQIQSEDHTVVIDLQLDGYTSVNKLELEKGSVSGTYTLLMQDADRRSLLLKANVVVYVCAQYWLINHTGLPLIFKQEGVSAEAAGQPPEHEAARSVVPLLFSFCDMEAPKLCCMRLGSRCQLATAGASGASTFQPKWSQPFPLESGVGICKLLLSSSDNSPDRMFNIGIYGKQGKGAYRDTHFIVFSPLFQLVNNTTMTLDFAQKFAARNGRPTGAGVGYEQHITSAMPSSSVAFHWPRVDLDPLLCIRSGDSFWSGGFYIDKAMSSTHIHVRTLNMQSLFILVEVRMHAGTYIVTFSQPDSAPKPMRVENLSEVSITFYQDGINEEARRYVVKAGSAMPYAWDEPTIPPLICVEAPGGSCETYDMRTFKVGNRLYYENFFYIAFTGTFLEPRPAVAQKSARSVRNEELVLDVTNEGRVVINRKITGSRSQLWRMTPERMLQHEGSSTPRVPQAREASPGSSRLRDAAGNQGRVFVLDIDAPAADPHRCVPLVLRKPDPRRRSLQTWTFTEEGTLKCDIENLYVQSKNGLRGLQRGVEAVLGSRTAYETTEYLPRASVNPLELAVTSATSPFQAGRHQPPVQPLFPLHCGVGIQKMRGGCGVLCVRVFLDGPTIVLRVTDLTREESSAFSGQQMTTLLPAQKRRVENSSGNDIQVKVNFKHGLGVSFINETEEILLVTLEGVLLSFYQNSAEDSQTFDMSVRQLQVDNMLTDAERPCALYISPPESRSDQHSYLPAFCIKASRLINYNTDTLVFDDTTLALEEKLMLKLFQMFRAFIPWLSESDDLHLIEQRTLAGDVLRDYERKLYFNKLQELSKQARTIMGNVDFFGSPLGFIQDVRGGFKEALNEKNPLTLFKSITHGASNSAAKLTGSLSDGLRSIANFDNNETALVVAAPTASGSEHFIGGLRGFSRGIVHGFTGLIVHPYHGLTTGGLTGFVGGVGKGIMGSGVLSAVGVLDLATGMAAALRDSSKTHARPARHRSPRLSRGPRGLLPVYSAQVAEGQMLLMRILAANGTHSPSERGIANEFFLVKHPLEGGNLLVVSNQRILGVSTKNMLFDEVHLSEVRRAHLVVTVGCSSLVLYLSGPNQQHKRIDCGDADDANISALQEIEKVINYSVCTCEEERFRIVSPEDDAD